MVRGSVHEGPLERGLGDGVVGEPAKVAVLRLEEEAEASDFCRWPPAPRPRGLSLVTRIISSEDVEGRGEPKPTRTRTSLTSSHGAAILLRRFYCEEANTLITPLLIIMTGKGSKPSKAAKHKKSAALLFFRSDRHRRPGLAVFSTANEKVVGAAG